jgi:hypothetical protein
MAPHGPMMPLTRPARQVLQSARISKLERDLVRLETIVETLVQGMKAEHEAMKGERKEDRDALKELGRKMEQSVASLTEEMKKLADRSSTVDRDVLAKQSQAAGAIDFGRWALGTLLTAAMLAAAYQAGNKSHDAQPAHQPAQTRQAQ